MRQPTHLPSFVKGTVYQAVSSTGNVNDASVMVTTSISFLSKRHIQQSTHRDGTSTIDRPKGRTLLSVAQKLMIIEFKSNNLGLNNASIGVKFTAQFNLNVSKQLVQCECPFILVFNYICGSYVAKAPVTVTFDQRMSQADEYDSQCSSTGSV